MALSYEKNKNITVEVIEKPEDFEYSEHYNTDTEKGALVKRVEALVRASMEYGDYIMYLRQNVGMDACAFFNNISKSSNKKIRIEIHHAPLTLYDIVKLVLDHAINMGEEIDDLLIADEVMKLHYMNNLGLIPLSKTLHEVVHNSDKITIPLYMIYGNLREFIDKYSLEIEENPQIKQKIQEAIKRTKDIKADSFSSLETNFRYLKVDGFEVPVKMDEVKEEDKKKLEAAENAAQKERREYKKSHVSLLTQLVDLRTYQNVWKNKCNSTKT